MDADFQQTAHCAAAENITGAGDIFGGSAVWQLLQLGKAPETLTEAELRQVTSFACAAASLSTTRPGGLSSVPEYEQCLAASLQLQA